MGLFLRTGVVTLTFSHWNIFIEIFGIEIFLIEIFRINIFRIGIFRIELFGIEMFRIEIFLNLLIQDRETHIYRWKYTYFPFQTAIIIHLNLAYLCKLSCFYLWILFNVNSLYIKAFTYEYVWNYTVLNKGIMYPTH